jgi:hypothetical protein
VKSIQPLAALGVLATAAAFANCSNVYRDSCFIGSTRVATPRGLRRIEELLVGDEVYAWDLVAHERVVRKVSAVHRAKAREVRRIRYASGAIGGVTPSHPVFAADSCTWIEARELTTGTPVLVWDLDSTRIETIAEITATEAPEPEFAVFNLTIDGPESNYFADGVLVHNKFSDGPMPDAEAYDGGTFALIDSATDAATSCVTDYSQARSCNAVLDAGDAGDAADRSNAGACKTSFDCPGTCCSCPVRDAGGNAEAGAADAGRVGFMAYACVCGTCQIDPPTSGSSALCAQMLAGDPTLCP